MHFYSFVFKNLIRRRVRSALTILGMAIAVGAVVALVGISQGFERSFFSVYQQQQVDLIVQQAGGKQRLTSTLDEKLGAKIEAIPGVVRVNSGLVDFISMPNAEQIGVILQGWPPDSHRFEDIKLLQGERLQAGDHKKILLGKVLAEDLEKKVGDTVMVFEDAPFEVEGVFESYNLFENGGVVMLLEDLQKQMGRPGKVTGFTVVLDDPGNPKLIERVKHDIEALSTNITAAPARDFVSQTTELKLARGMAWITSAVAVFIGSVGVLNTMLMSVFERTREIGILRAIGWGPMRIVRMILMESVVLSVIGGLVGVVLALAMTEVLGRMPLVAGLIDKSIPREVIVQGLVIALAVGLLGAAYPAYRGARLMPTEAIRHE